MLFFGTRQENFRVGQRMQWEMPGVGLGSMCWMQSYMCRVVRVYVQYRQGTGGIAMAWAVLESRSAASAATGARIEFMRSHSCRPSGFRGMQRSCLQESYLCGTKRRGGCLHTQVCTRIICVRCLLRRLPQDLSLRKHVCAFDGFLL